MKNFLIVGYSPTIIKLLENSNDLNLYIMEEKEIILANQFDKHEVKNTKIFKEIIYAKYMNNDEYLYIIDKFIEKIKFDAIMPVKDYAVRAASKLADKYGLKGIGIKNSKILTNKILLRETCRKYLITYPRFKKIKTINDLKEFYKGKPIIFKPANRQASLGISKIDSIEDIENAWNYTINAEESEKQVIKKDLITEYIAEEFVDGYEVSVETIVQDGKVIFNNVTSKISLEDTFIEMGHIVPACINETVVNELQKEKLNFIRKLNIQNGILHSEWKISNGKPILIECAGRTPGDGIPILISHTYGFNFFEVLCRIYLGEKIHIPNIPLKISTSRFFHNKEGILKNILGLELLEENENIIKYVINFKINDVIKKAKSSWDRLGMFFLCGNSYDDVEKEVSRINNNVKFIIK